MNLPFRKAPRCMCQKDMNLKGDGKTCEKTQILQDNIEVQGECFVGSLKKYIFVSELI